MKKITLLFLLSISITFNSYAQFPENFDSGIPITWTTFIGTNGEGTTENWEYDASGYVYCYYEAVSTFSEDWLVTPQVAITAANSILTFNFTDYYASDYGSNYEIRISSGASQTTHGDFSIVETFTEADIPTNQSFGPGQVDLSAYIGSSIYIAFVLVQNDGDDWYLDDINLVPNASAPEPTTAPSPLNGATNVLIDESNSNAVAWSWSAATTGDPATSYDVYLGDSPSTLNLLGNTSNDFVNITGMEYSTLYYWQIVAKNVGGDAVSSSTWSFTTEADSSLSIDDLDSSLFAVYPNPVKDFVKIKTNEIIDIVTVANQLGQRVLEFNGEQIFNNEVDLSKLSNGLYFISIKAENKEQSIKIIKE